MLLKRLHKAWEARRDFVHDGFGDAFRLVSGAADGLPGLTIDVYAGHFFLTLEAEAWLGQQGPLRAALESLRPQLASPVPAKFYWISNLPKARRALPSDAPEQLVVREGPLNFEVHLGDGPHTGLFLDQRDNRRRVLEHASGLRCLNLFAYTGAFTVAAAKGGAAEVLSIDLSKNALKWMARNLALNHLETRRSTSLAQDVFRYLPSAQAVGERFDLIILDPPTFSRSGDKTFSTERDFGPLLQDCIRLLAPRGQLLACLNTKKIAAQEFRNLIKTAIQPFGKKILEIEAKDPQLKSCWME